MELHVFIEVMAPIPEAYLRMAHAMEEVKKFLIPVCVQENLLHPNLQNILCTSHLRLAFQMCMHLLLLVPQGTAMQD